MNRTERAVIVWKPQPRQLEFMRRPEPEALYGGAAGGGKSDARSSTSRCSKMSRTGPSAIMPPCAMTTARSAKSRTTSMSWQTMTTVVPARFMALMCSIISMHSL